MLDDLFRKLGEALASAAHPTPHTPHESPSAGRGVRPSVRQADRSPTGPTTIASARVPARRGERLPPRPSSSIHREPATTTDLSAQRIYIAGPGGSGKTTLARQIAGQRGSPCYLFDDIAYDPVTHRRRPDESRLAAVRAIAAQPAWVVDCWYMGWTDDLLGQADLIIWLDLPWRVTGWRILRRHVLADLSGNNPHPGLRKLFRFLWSERRGYLGPPSSQSDLLRRDANNRATTARVLAGHRAKVAHCRRSADVAALNRRLTAPSPASGTSPPGRPR